MALERPKSLRELALEYLRNRIVDGTFQMGQVLSERKISEELGVSKSPVREALAQLRDEGLVDIEPQKGARVFTLSEEEVIQICDFRQAIESASFELALQRDPARLAKIWIGSSRRWSPKKRLMTKMPISRSTMSFIISSLNTQATIT